MKRLILLGLAAFFGAITPSAHAMIPAYVGITTPTAGKVTQYLSGNECIAASSSTAGTCALDLDGTTGKIKLSGISSNTLVYVNSSSITTGLPQMGAGGLVIGSGVGAVPSTGTLTGSARIAVTNGAGSVSLDTVGISSTGSAGQYLQNAQYVKGLAVGGDFTTAGVGDSVKAATETFSGAKTFTSSATAGPTVYTTTATTGPGATVAAGRFVNTWMVVASTNPGIGTSSITFTGLQADKFYRIRMMVDMNTTAGYFGWRFNGDATASAYKWAGQGLNTNGTRNDVTSSGDNECQQGTFTMQTGFPTLAEITFRTSPSDNTRVMSNLTLSTSDTNPFYITLQGVCFYDGASALSSINLYPSAGSYSGWIQLEQFMTALP